MKRSNLKDRTKSGQKDQSLRALFSLYRYNWKRLTPIFLTRILSNLFVALLPYFIGRIAGLITSQNVEFGELVKIVSIMVMSNLVHDILWRASGLMSIYRMTPVLYQLRTISQQFVWKYQYKDFTEKPSGKIASSLQDIYGRGSQIIVEFEEDDIEQMVKFPIFIGILLLATKENAILFAFFTVLLICVSWLSLKKS